MFTRVDVITGYDCFVLLLREGKGNPYWRVCCRNVLIVP